ncbi:MAG: hypothetical protein MUE71_09430, partial [Chitinophagaceae bacterium]|nr:hypothetical protein [Chitinophagaceae bacterium]
DSNLYLLKLRWSQPNFSTDFSNAKFISEVDVETGDFSNPISSTVLGSFTDSFQAKVINAFLLDKGYPFDQYVKMKTRVIASYSNNNDRQVSNTQTFDFRVYKVPPQVTLPVSKRLFIVGDATMAWWNLPLVNNGINYGTSQEFMRIDETTYGGKIFLYGNKQYLLVPYNDGRGWDLKYAVQNTFAPGLSAGGRFGHRPSSSTWDANFPSPADDGFYNMTYDFQNGFFTVTDERDKPVPDSLYAIGGGTQGGWDNSHGNTALKAQWMRRLNSSVFEKDLNLTGGGMLKFITKITQWQPQFGRGTGSNGLGYNYGGGSDPDVIIIPPASGMYRVRVDFYTMTYTLTKL